MIYYYNPYFQRVNALSGTRRILEISGTYYVSLPKPWVKFHKLKRGDIVFVKMSEEGTLEILPKEEREEEVVRSVKVQLDDYVDRRILAAYLSGYDIIDAVTTGRVSDRHRKMIESVASKLIGLEIVEETQNRITLQSFSKGPIEVWSIIKRMSDIAKSMYTDSLFALLKSDTELASSVIKRDDNVDRLYFFLVRIIRSNLSSLRRLLKEKKFNALELLNYRLLVKALEQIADHSEGVARSVIRILNKGIMFSKEINDSLLEISRDLRRAQDKVLEAYRTKNLIEAVEVVKDVHLVYEKLDKIEVRFKEYGYRWHFLMNLTEELRNIAKIIEDIGDLVF